MKLLGLILVFALLGCDGGWEKDPFFRETEDIRKGIPPGVQTKPVPPLRDVVFIDADDFYDFREGEERIIKLDFRTTHSAIEPISFEIQDMENRLPGAVYDAAEKTLTWTPEKGTIKQDGFIARIPVTLVLYVSEQGIPQEFRKEVSFNVLKKINGPEILSIEGLANDIEESRAYNFTAKVRDPDSIKGALNAPTLLPITMVNTSYVDLSKYISIKSQVQDANDPTLWTYQLELDLRNIEVTKTYSWAQLNLQAFNQHGFRSTTFNHFTRIETYVTTPQINVFSNVPMTATQEGVYHFDVLDPKFEGSVTVSFKSSCGLLQPAASCTCTNSLGRARCTVKWTPEKEGRFSISLKAQNSVYIFGVYKNSLEINGTVTFDVAAAPTPTPPPGPTGE